MLCWYLQKPTQKKGKYPWVSDWSAFLHLFIAGGGKSSVSETFFSWMTRIVRHGLYLRLSNSWGGVCCLVMGVFAVKYHFCLEGVIGQSAVSQSWKAWPSSLERDMGMLITCSHPVLSYFKKYVWSEFIFHVQCILEFLLFLLESGR